MIEQSTDSIIQTDQDFHIAYINKMAQELFGYTLEEVKGKTLDLFSAETDAYEIQQEIYDAVSSGKSISKELLNRRKDGSDFICQTTVSPLKNQKGEIYAYMVSQRDITDRVHTEEALRESEEWLRAIFEANPDPVVVYNTKGHPEYLNPAFTEVFGWSLNELRGNPIPFVPGNQKEITSTKIKELFDSGKPVRMGSQRLTKDGRTVDVLISASGITGSEGEIAGMVVNLTDISESKRLERQFQQAQKMEAVGILAGGIAHNFNNVLTGIQARTQLMMMDKDSSHPEFEYLREIDKYVETAAELTRDLLGFARGGKYEVKPSNLNSLIKQETQMFGRTKKELRINEKYDKDLWIAEVDQSQMQQVLMNLYINAWQAMPGGGELYIQTKNVTIGRDYVKPFEIIPGRYVKISVTDTGVGMDDATKEKIFEPFFTTQGKGTGLGLSSVYGIVKNHGGFINVYSEKGEGTTFNIYLPASEAEVSDQNSAPSEEPVHVQCGEGTVLLVDDEKMVMDSGERLLKNLGYRVLVAGSGKEAIDIYEKNKDDIDMVILDLIMPMMSGGETYDRLKQMNPDIKVLLSSGYSMNNLAKDMLNRGCNGFIQKPFNSVTLSQKVKEVLNR